MAYCPDCGAEIKKSEKFCPGCGKRLMGEEKGMKEVKRAAPAIRKLASLKELEKYPVLYIDPKVIAIEEEVSWKTDILRALCFLGIPLLLLVVIGAFWVNKGDIGVGISILAGVLILVAWLTREKRLALLEELQRM